MARSSKFIASGRGQTLQLSHFCLEMVAREKFFSSHPLSLSHCRSLSLPPSRARALSPARSLSRLFSLPFPHALPPFSPFMRNNISLIWIAHVHTLSVHVDDVGI